MSPLDLALDATPTLAPRGAAGRWGLALAKALLRREDPDLRLRVFLQSLLRGPGPEHSFLLRDAVRIIRRRGRPAALAKSWAAGGGPLPEELAGPGADAFVVLDGPVPRCPRPPVAAFDAGPGGPRPADDGAALALAPSRWREEQLRAQPGRPGHRVAFAPWGFDESVFKRLDERVVHIAAQSVGVGRVAFLLARSGHGAGFRNGMLLDLYEELLRRQPKRCPELLVEGWGGKPPAELKARPALHRRVVVLPWVDEETLAGLFNGAAAVVLAAERTAHWLDAAEPMACSAPVAAPAGSAYAETAGPGCLAIEGADPARWADAVESIAFDAEAHRGAAEAAAERSAAWRSAECVDPFLEAVRGLAI